MQQQQGDRGRRRGKSDSPVEAATAEEQAHQRSDSGLETEQGRPRAAGSNRLERQSRQVIQHADQPIPSNAQPPNDQVLLLLSQPTLKFSSNTE